METIPNERVTDSGSKKPVGPGLGCAVIVFELFVWLFAADPPSSRHVTFGWKETSLYEALIFGSLGAGGVSYGLVATRIGRPKWVGVIATLMSGSLVVKAIVTIGQWL
jgi:hypothetical protein